MFFSIFVLLLFCLYHFKADTPPATHLVRPKISLESITPNLFVRHVAGTGTAGFSGDNGQATAAQVATQMIWVDPVGIIYVPDAGNARIRKIGLNGIITTFGG